jgi:ribonucleoside-diphosphate reductase alpha chain
MMDREVGAQARRTGKAARRLSRRGLSIRRRFTARGVDPADELVWETRTAQITGEGGKVIFEQRDVEVPKTWSLLATNVVASKYFRGHLGEPDRERSVRQLVSRVVRTIGAWGRKDGYFATEEDAQAFEADLAHLIYRQKMSFNSPVWFNVGIEEKPQCSACFINSVSDSMDSILRLAHTEGMLFKYGSGTGSNLSRIRSSREKLSGGGEASGPVSFMRGFDAFAGVIKSGGKTRRAAKMVILDADHPDVVEFASCKAEEEKKAWALIEAGYDGAFNAHGGAYDSVFFQNANHSIRVTDDFMRAVAEDREWDLLARIDGRPVERIRARELMDRITEAAWVCGDPGLQFDTTVNAWHTCPATDRINASNPCVTGDTLVATSEGWRRIDALLDGPARVIGADGALHDVAPAFETGVKPVYRLTTAAGFELKLTGDHRVLTRNRGDVPACELTKDDVLVLGRPPFGTAHLDDRLAEFLGLLVGDGCLAGEQEAAVLTLAPDEGEVARRTHERITSFKKEFAADARAARDMEVTHPQGTLRLATSARCVVVELKRFAVLDGGSQARAFRPELFSLDRESIAAVLRGLYTADGTVANYGEKSQYVSLESVSLELLRQTQLLLLGFGVKSKLYRDRRVAGRHMALLPDGRGGRKEYPVAQIHSLRISRSSRAVFEREIGFVPGSAKAAQLAELNREVSAYSDRLEDRVVELEFVGEEPVYDLTEPATHHFVAAGIVVHNCSEYMFLDDSACNLASLNLMHFRSIEGGFDAEAFRHAVDLTILAQEILVSNARYPTERIGENSEKFRPLGLGYANLGALLMASGVPYDSESGRATAAVITALMTGQAYAMSARIAERVGPFAGYERNREPFLGVIRKHAQQVDRIDAARVEGPLLEAARQAWADALRLGIAHGYRNAQVSVLAPTGTIGFMMDCDTTGIEPDIALVKYKKLVGGGVLKIVNNTVPLALKRLGYTEQECEDVLHAIDEMETIEGAPGLASEHLAVFDCAFKPTNGSRSIHYMGHIRMMGAVQPFLSGAISKTVNMPNAATPREIEQAYLEAWKLGLKAIAVYRDGCKRSQPLNTGASRDEGARREAPAEGRLARRRLPDERRSITHKFSIGGHEGYMTVGMYEDGAPGELFVTMAKEGSVVSGLMDSFATSISMALQYGVPLKVLCDKFSHTRFEPSGFTGNPEIPIAKSITDYIFRWLALKFIPSEDGLAVAPPRNLTPGAAPALPAARASTRTVEAQATLSPPAQPNGQANGKAGGSNGHGGAFVNSDDAPPCPSCGSITVRNGACYKCVNCGTTTGCS